MLVRQAYTPIAIDIESEPFEDPIETEEPQSPPITLAPIHSPDYILATPLTNKEPEASETSRTRIASPYSTTPPSCSTSPLSPNHPLRTQTLPTPTHPRAFYYRSTARMVVRTQPTLSPGISARVIEVMTLSLSSFLKRYRSSYETPSSSSSPASSPTLPSRKSSESEEAASEGQQQAVPDEDITVDEPLGLGYEAARHRALELAECTMPSTYEDPEEGTIYVDIECDMPQVRAPVQTPASPEWSSSSLPVSPTSLTVPSPVATPTSVEPVDEGFLAELGAQLKLHGSILHDHTQRLDALPPTLGDFYTLL
ncbi:hypothetical protein Tco_1063448, partial [Tanacetum coccineum]